MSEQTVDAGKDACPHPEAVGMRWGDPISAERQAEPQAVVHLRTARTHRDTRKGHIACAGQVAAADERPCTTMSERSANGASVPPLDAIRS
jgi:hypothetical protein